MPPPRADHARDRFFSVVLHDVAPSTWPAYRAFVEAVDRIGGIALTLLVVPDFHRQGAIVHDAPFRAAMDARVARGDELVLHGFHHADEAPPPRTPRDFFMRRIYTHEGEFQAIDAADARARIASGLSQFAACGWTTNGFVAPAWLLNEASKKEVAAAGFSYTSDPSGMILLPEWRHLPAPSLVWSARSPWRRALSRAWNERLCRVHAQAGLLRLGLHPVDMAHASATRWWLDTTIALRATRTAVTKSQALDRMESAAVRMEAAA